MLLRDTKTAGCVARGLWRGGRADSMGAGSLSCFPLLSLSQGAFDTSQVSPRARAASEEVVVVCAEATLLELRTERCNMPRHHIDAFTHPQWLAAIAELLDRTCPLRAKSDPTSSRASPR